jgi:hypothetical protein
MCCYDRITKINFKVRNVGEEKELWTFLRMVMGSSEEWLQSKVRDELLMLLLKNLVPCAVLCHKEERNGVRG